MYTHFSTEIHSVPYFIQKLGSYFLLPKYTSTLPSWYQGTHSIGNRYGRITLHSFPVTHTPTDVSAMCGNDVHRRWAQRPHLLSRPFCSAVYLSVVLSHTYVFLLAMLPPEYTLFFTKKKKINLKILTILV